MWNIIFFNLCLILYSISVITYLVFIVCRHNWLNKSAYILTWSAFFAHTIFFFLRFFEVTYLPLVSLFESMSFLSWTLIVIFLWLESKYQLKSLGAFILPLALFILLCGSLFSKDVGSSQPILKSYWFLIHVGLAFLGYAAFATAFDFGIMYLLQERELRLKKQGLLYYQLPALELLDTLCYQSIMVGFVCLSLAIISGAVWANSAWGSYWTWQPKQTWSLVTWLVYATCLHSRLFIGWRGRRMACWAIFGFGVVLFTYLGVNILLTGLHSF